MRAILVLALTALACSTVTYNFVRASSIRFDDKGHADTAQREYKALSEDISANPDEARQKQLFWLSCETGRYDQARAILNTLHKKHASEATDKYSAVYSNDFTKMAQIEIAALKFTDALSVYEEQFAYDSRFLPANNATIGRDCSNIATVYFMLGQTSSDGRARNGYWEQADNYLRQAETVSGKSGTLPNLAVQQDMLVMAQGRNDGQEAQFHRKKIEELRSNLHLKVPVVQF